MNLNDLSHSGVGILVSLIGSFAVLCGILIGAIYKMNNRMISAILATQRQCQDSLPLLYALKADTEAHIAKIFNRQDRLRDEILPGAYVLRQEVLAWNLMNENGFRAVTARLDVVCLKLDRMVEKGAVSKQEVL